jgi:hypothetical protein
VEPEKIDVYRIIPIENLESDLRNGLFAKNYAPEDPGRTIIGNAEIILERDNREVPCFPGTTVNDYVPFYFSTRTPMLYNILTGRGVPKRNQEDIIYLCCSLKDLTKNSQWCFTDGNAAKKLTKYYCILKPGIPEIDWEAVQSTDFRMETDHGDRIRKKHAEFLVKEHVSPNKIHSIIVYNEGVKSKVENILKSCNLEKKVMVSVDLNYYF